MIERPDNLTDLVFAAIRDQIVDAVLPPGSSVSEATLARELTVSKTPVREALLRLRRIGLVEPTSRGLRVATPSVRHAYEYRAVLEAGAATYAAAHATGEQLDVITRWASESLGCARTGDPADFRQTDHRFHVAVAEASGNEFLRSAIEDAFVLTMALRQRDVSLVRDFVPDALEHLEIAEALRTGNAAAASALLANHALRIMDQLLDAMATPTTPTQPALLAQPATSAPALLAHPATSAPAASAQPDPSAQPGLLAQPSPLAQPESPTQLSPAAAAGSPVSAG